MTAPASPNPGTAIVNGKGSPRLALLACSATHFLNDGLMSSIYPLLPFLAVDFGLSYAAVGLVRTSLSGTASLFQVPAGIIAERIGERWLLGLGMAWFSVGFLALGLAGTFGLLLAVAVTGGLGSSTQHPLAAAIVSRAYEHRGRATALSTLNFAGDLGKVALPFIAGLIAVNNGWRISSGVLGLMGILLTLVFGSYLAGLRTPASATAADGSSDRGWGIERPGRFALLATIGVIDETTRVGALTFLPFLLVNKGLDAAATSALIALIFACGAAGKLGCGVLADRFGNVALIVLTELVTSLAVLLVVPATAAWLIPILVVFGFVLNGTSSTLYATVADLVAVGRRARGYGLYYSCTLGMGTLAPVLYGLMADRFGVPNTFVGMAGLTLLTVPLAFGLRHR